MPSMSRDTAIRYLVEHRFIEEVVGSNESKAGVVRFTKHGVSSGNTPQYIKYCVLRIPKSTLVRLYNEKTPSSFETISALYSVGLGVPKDSMSAQFWHHKIYNKCNCEGYKFYRKKLKEDLKKTIKRAYYVYSNDVIKQNRMLDHVKCKKTDVRCVVLYKDSVTGFNLHNIIAEDGTVLIYNVRANALEIANSIEVPKTLKNVKFVAQLGYLSQTDKYSFDFSIQKALKYFSSENSDEKFQQRFSKGVKFNLTGTAVVDYRWNIQHLRRKLNF